MDGERGPLQSIIPKETAAGQEKEAAGFLDRDLERN